MRTKTTLQAGIVHLIRNSLAMRRARAQGLGQGLAPDLHRGQRRSATATASLGQKLPPCHVHRVDHMTTGYPRFWPR